jgi:serine/threonine-protein kinase
MSDLLPHTTGGGGGYVPARSADPLTGSVLDKYEVLHKLGEGGMATVYRGRHTTLGRDVAIKVLHPHLSRLERNRARFAREARAIEHLDHDNILKIFDYSGSEVDESYIVTEFVDGATLQQLNAERGRVPSEVVSMVGIKLAKALAYAHGLGIIHRDLKPDNVMVRRDGAVKLMDFGIARFLDEVNLTVTGALVGSPAYMSPEQAMERVLDPRSDLFSLGTLLFQLATGQLPFPGSNPSIILRNIIEGNRPEVLELAPDISGVLADLIERLLQNNLEDRPQNAQAIEIALAQSLAEVRIDPDDEALDIHAWLVDPAGHEQRLKAHLKGVLMSEGKARLANRDTLGALRLFNRLLAIDEENEEVLQLVQAMHTPAPNTGPNPRWGWLSLGAVALSVLAAVTLWPSPEPAPTNPDLAEVEPVEEPAPQPVEFPVNAEPPVFSEGPAPATPPRAERPAMLARPTGLRTLPTPAAPDRVGAGDPEQAPAASQVATVAVAVNGGAWATIEIDREPKGRTGSVGDIAVTPGKHTLTLKNPLAQPYTTTFEVAAGERKEIVVPELTPLPLTARLAGGFADTCVVSVDGVSRGTLAAIGRDIAIHDPRVPHAVELSCPEGVVVRRELPANARPGSTVVISPP